MGKSCWEYLHPDEIPFARAVHGRGVQLDKAAVLNYCQIKNKDGRWVGCECVFTIAYDVIIACTSIFRSGAKSQSMSGSCQRLRTQFLTCGYRKSHCGSYYTAIVLILAARSSLPYAVVYFQQIFARRTQPPSRAADSTIFKQIY